MKKLLTIILVLCSVASFGQMRGGAQYDPGAARKNLSNVDALQLKLGAGTAAAPSYSFSSDTNTGIYSPAADTIGFAAGGAERAKIDAYGIQDPELESELTMINGFQPKRWGFKIDTTESDPASSVTYLYDAAGLTPVSMTFDGGTGKGTMNYGDWYPFLNALCRPVMLNPDGSVAYELDHNDQTKKIDGTASDIESTAHNMNAMVEVKRLWKRIYADGTDIYVIFSNVQYDPNYEASAYTNSSGKVNDRFYYSMFEGSNVSSKLRSLATGTIMAGAAGATEIDYADNNGAGWYITAYSQHNQLALLHVLLSKSLATQEVFGRGNESGGAFIDPGAMKAEGAFAGYNTTDSAKSVKTFYIEHFWGNYWGRCAGLLYRNDSGTGKVYIKNSPPYNNTGVGYVNTGITPSGTVGGYINSMTVSNSALIPAAVSGSNTTYYADGLWWSLPTNSGDCHFALVAGSRGDGALCGAFTVILNHPLSDAYSFVGARLSFLKE